MLPSTAATASVADAERLGIQRRIPYAWGHYQANEMHYISQSSHPALVASNVEVQKYGLYRRYAHLFVDIRALEDGLQIEPVPLDR